LEVGDGVFEVLSTSGDTHLGGDDFDKVFTTTFRPILSLSLSAHTHFAFKNLALNFKRDEGIDLLKDKQALQRLTEAAEKAKIELSSLTQTNIRISLNFPVYIFITATADGPKHIDTSLTRAKFEELCSDLHDSYSGVSDFMYGICNTYKSSTLLEADVGLYCRLKTPVDSALKDAKLSFKDIDEVILVGGSIRIPALQELVKKIIGK
ncbi:hypothetical protein IFM89_018539, partial [Coptis chinensis]